MTKYAFLNFPTSGQVNPTLAIVKELVARGEDVVYFNFEEFRTSIEAMGAKFRPYDAALFRKKKSGSAASAFEANRRLVMLPIRMIQTSKQMVPPLLEMAQAEHPDCLIYSDMFLWARIIAHALGITGVALRPTYAPNAAFRKFMLEGTGIYFSRSGTPAWLNEALAQLRRTYSLPFYVTASLIRGNEGLTILFLPRAFQPDGDAFGERFLFVGPAFHPERDRGHGFPFARLAPQPRLYISLGTIYNNRAEFYNTCFDAFGNSDRQVILGLGHQVDPAALHTIPANFITAASVPQLEILTHTDIFISQGGMNSTMESLYYGVPLIVIPHINEQKITAQRIQQLGLGLAIDEQAVTAGALNEAVSRVTQESGFATRARAMQQIVREAGGYRRAADALQHYVHTQTDMC